MKTSKMTRNILRLNLSFFSFENPANGLQHSYPIAFFVHIYRTVERIMRTIEKSHNSKAYYLDGLSARCLVVLIATNLSPVLDIPPLLLPRDYYLISLDGGVSLSSEINLSLSSPPPNSDYHRTTTCFFQCYSRRHRQ